jgi:hypothetical protein
MFNYAEELPSARPSHILKLGSVATLLVIAVIAGFILLNPAPREPVGEVLDVRLYAPPPPVVQADGLVLASAPAPALPSRTLLVLTPVKIHNTSDQPFSVFDLTGTVRLGNAEYESSNASAEDFQKVFYYYPELASYRQPALQRHAAIPPGATASGLLVFSYPLTEQQWSQRASFHVKASFDRGKDIVLTGTDTPQALSQLVPPAQ